MKRGFCVLAIDFLHDLTNELLYLMNFRETNRCRLAIVL